MINNKLIKKIILFSLLLTLPVQTSWTAFSNVQENKIGKNLIVSAWIGICVGMVYFNWKKAQKKNRCCICLLGENEVEEKLLPDIKCHIGATHPEKIHQKCLDKVLEINGQCPLCRAADPNNPSQEQHLIFEGEVPEVARLLEILSESEEDNGVYSFLRERECQQLAGLLNIFPSEEERQDIVIILQNAQSASAGHRLEQQNISAFLSQEPEIIETDFS